MVALDKIIQMKRQGYTEGQIINALQDQGISPKEISDALTQSQIKQAVSAPTQNQENQEMQHSIMNPDSQENQTSSNPKIPVPPPQTNSPQNQSQNYSDQETYDPQTPEIPQQNYSQNYNPQGYSSQDYPQQEYSQNYNQQNYSSQDYPQQEYNEKYYPQESYYQEGYSQGGMDNMIEIAEQVFSEKTKKLKNQVEDLVESKNLLTTKIENLSERLKRMEKMFDQMQISIIEKVGQYGKGLDSLKKELNMVEDSFSKIVNKVVDKKSSSKKHKK